MSVEVTVSGIVSGDPQEHTNRAGDVHVRFTVVSTHPSSREGKQDQRLGSHVHIMAYPPLADRILAEIFDGTYVVVHSDFLDAEAPRDDHGVHRPHALIRATKVEAVDVQSLGETPSA